MSSRRRHPLMRVFLRGVAIVLPLALTLFLLVWLWGVLDEHLFARVEAGLAWGARELGYDFDPDEQKWLSAAVSVVFVLLGILVVGWWLGGILGRRVYAVVDRMLHHTPVVSAVYPHVKQITEFFLGTDAQVEFERVVAIPYPRKGIYSLAFVTGSSLRSLQEATQDDLVSVFVPSSPMPVTGYTLFVPRTELITVNMTVEEALRTVISGGVLVTPKEKPIESA